MCRKSSAPAHSGSRGIGFMDASSRLASTPGLHVPPSGQAKYVRVANHGFYVFTRHETRLFQPFGSLWECKGRTTRNRRPDWPRRPVTAFLCAMGRLWSGRSGKLPLSRCPHIFRRPRSTSRRAPFATAPVALPEFFEEHAESLELWSPGYPLFPPGFIKQAGEPPAGRTLTDILDG